MVVLLFAVFLVVLSAAVSAVIIAIPVWYLWNWLMPVLFHFPNITLEQAFGLALLSGLLFRSSYSSKK